MRLRVFTGRTVHEAMQALRRALGDEAVILATAEDEEGVRITAGVELASDPLDQILRSSTSLQVVERLALALSFHQAGSRRIERLCLTARESGASEPEDVLAFALAEHCRFASLRQRHGVPIVLAGGPGVGKTVMVARLAAAARLAGLRVRVTSTDDQRKGGTAQLEALLEVMGIPLERLAAFDDARHEQRQDALLLVDTAAVDLLCSESLVASAALAKRLDGELLPVLPADLLPIEAYDQAVAWRALGATRFLAARLDTTRRLGMLLAVADAGLAFAGAGIAPRVAEPLKALTPANLARLLLHRAEVFAGESRS
jgi:flagellar biosynthesis protein FlhF